MLSIISTIYLRSASHIFIIDEPLNNLDMNSIIKISNLLNFLVREKKGSLFIIVSHCKIFPFITNVVKIENHNLIEQPNNLKCYACFGEHDENGFY